MMYFSWYFQDKTGSATAIDVLQNWEEFLPKFWQLVPPSEEDTPEASQADAPSVQEELVSQSVNTTS